MDQYRIFGPVFVMMLLTLVVWLYMYTKRLLLIRSERIDPQQLTPAELARRSPPSVSNPSDNFKNLFEVPVIFYTLALYLFVMHQVDSTYLVAAWFFVTFRVLHSAVHCTINIVKLRFALYATSCVFVFFMLVRAALAFFST